MHRCSVAVRLAPSLLQPLDSITPRHDPSRMRMIVHGGRLGPKPLLSLVAPLMPRVSTLDYPPSPSGPLLLMLIRWHLCAWPGSISESPHTDLRLSPPLCRLGFTGTSFW